MTYNWKPMYLDTFFAESPKLFNDNFTATETFINVFYDASRGVIISPIATPGNISAGQVQGVTGVFDTLIVKQQFTNLYENTTTIDKDWYNTYAAASDVSTRDASTWENASYRYVDVISPYFRVNNWEAYYGFKTTQLGQEFQFQLADPSGAGNYTFLLDPSVSYSLDSSLATTDGTETLEISVADSSAFWLKLIAIEYDASWGTKWEVKEFGGNYIRIIT